MDPDISRNILEAYIQLKMQNLCKNRRSCSCTEHNRGKYCLLESVICTLHQLSSESWGQTEWNTKHFLCISYTAIFEFSNSYPQPKALESTPHKKSQKGAGAGALSITYLFLSLPSFYPAENMGIIVIRYHLDGLQKIQSKHLLLKEFWKDRSDNMPYHRTSPYDWCILFNKQTHWHTLDRIHLNRNHLLICQIIWGD